MPSYTSLQKQITDLIGEINSREFSEYTNNLLTKEDKIFLDKKITTIEKITRDIDLLSVGSGKIDRYVMKYVKALMLFSFFKRAVSLTWFCIGILFATNQRYKSKST